MHKQEIESLTVAVTSVLVGIYRNVPKRYLPTVARQRAGTFNIPKTKQERDDREFARRMQLINLKLNTPRRTDDVE